MHNAMDMGVLQCFKHFVGIHPDVHVIEFAGKYLCLLVWDILEHKRWSLADGIAQNVNKSDDIWSAIESLEDFNFAVLLFDSDWFQDFDYALLIVLQVATLKDFRVFASSELVVAVVIVEGVPVKTQLFIVRKTLRSFSADELVWACKQSIFDLTLVQLLRLDLIHGIYLFWRLLDHFEHS